MSTTLDSKSESHPSSRLAKASMPLSLGIVALYWVSALHFLVQFGCRIVFRDQWMWLDRYLRFDWQGAVFWTHNSHPKVIAHLVYFLDVYLGWPNQSFLLAFGFSFATALVLLLITMIWKERSASRPHRYASIAIVTSLVFWTANAHVLFWGFDSAHSYLLLSSFVLALLATAKAKHFESSRGACGWMFLAGTLATVSSMCFGPGLMTFPAIALLSFTLRTRLVSRLMALSFLVVAMALYFTLANPLSSQQSFSNLGRVIVFSWMWLGAPLKEIVEGFELAVGSSRFISVSCGALGLAYTAWLAYKLLALWKGSRRPSSLEVVGLGLGIVGVLISVQIGLARPLEQALAERYMIWRSASYCGLVLLATASVSRWRRARWVLPGLGVLVPLALLPSHLKSAGEVPWRRGEIVSLGLLCGVRDEAMMKKISPAQPRSRREIPFRVAPTMKRKRLMIFSNPLVDLIGRRFSECFELGESSLETRGAQVVRVLENKDGKTHFGRFWGEAYEPFNGTVPEYVVVVGSQGFIKGLGIFRTPSYLNRSHDLPLTFSTGFRGYIRDFRATEKLYYFAILHGGRVAVPLDARPPLKDPAKVKNWWVQVD